MKQIDVSESDMTTLVIKDLKTKVFLAELNEGRTVKFVYQGKLLDDKAKLDQFGFVNNPFIHCILSQPLGGPVASSTSQLTSVAQLKRELLQEIEYNLEGSLTEGEKLSLRQYKNLISTSTDEEIEQQRQYLTTLRTLRMANRDTVIRPEDQAAIDVLREAREN